MSRIRSAVLLTLAALLAGTALLSSSASAATSGAKFKQAAGTILDNGALRVTFDESGLGNENITYRLTADAKATYACINGGSKNPSAANKRTVAGQVTAGGTFQAKNGRVIASLTTGPLSPGSFTCPSGQRLVLASVSYTNIVLTDTTNNVSRTVADKSRTFLAL